jgi:phage terminase small subunit
MDSDDLESVKTQHLVPKMRETVGYKETRGRKTHEAIVMPSDIRGSNGLVNIRETRFVHEYVLCGNAAEAARRANYAEKYAALEGAKLLKKPRILDAIAKIEEQHMNAANLTITRKMSFAEKVLRKLEERLDNQAYVDQGDGRHLYLIADAFVKVSNEMSKMSGHHHAPVQLLIDSKNQEESEEKLKELVKQYTQEC